MRRRSFVALGGGLACAALAGVRLGFPKYRVRLFGATGYVPLGEWEVSAIEKAPDLWEEYCSPSEPCHPFLRTSNPHLWIDPTGGSGWDSGSKPGRRYQGEAAYNHGPPTDPRRPAHIWGSPPWGDARDLVTKHDGLCVTWEQIT
jgi:hypothetical protein